MYNNILKIVVKYSYSTTRKYVSTASWRIVKCLII